MLTDINLSPLMPDKNNNFGGSLVNDDVMCNPRIVTSQKFNEPPYNLNWRATKIKTCELNLSFDSCLSHKSHVFIVQIFVLPINLSLLVTDITNLSHVRKQS